jgi:hypothetical protein
MANEWVNSAPATSVTLVSGLEHPEQLTFDPATGETPKVSADEAVATVKASNQALWADAKSPVAELVYFSMGVGVTVPSGMKPSPFNHILSWVVQVSDVPLAYGGGPPNTSDSSPSSTSAASTPNSTVQFIVDATTGSLLTRTNFVPQ